MRSDCSNFPVSKQGQMKSHGKKWEADKKKKNIHDRKANGAVTGNNKKIKTRTRP